MPLLIILTALVVAAGLLREFVFVNRLDERQHHISHFSGPVAYFTYATLVVFVIINESFSRSLTATLIFWLLLLLALLFEIAIVLLQQYGSLPMRVADDVRLFFRGIVPSTAADERQLMIGNFFSHIAFYVCSILTIAAMLWLYIRKDQNPPNLWYLLLIVPPMAELHTSLLLSYGATRGTQFISATIVGVPIIASTTNLLCGAIHRCNDCWAVFYIPSPIARSQPGIVDRSCAIYRYFGYHQMSSPRATAGGSDFDPIGGRPPHFLPRLVSKGHLRFEAYALAGSHSGPAARGCAGNVAAAKCLI